MLPPDKRLFTPGPLTTSRTVKEAMLRDVGSRDEEFIGWVRAIRGQLLELGGVSQEQGYEAVLMQGSGTFGIESVLSTVIPKDGHLLLLVNGAYGERMVEIARRLGLAHHVLRTPENVAPQAAAVSEHLAQHSDTTHVAMVHCETTTGILNPVDTIGPVARLAGKTFIVDAMSSFGAIPLHLSAMRIDFLISSANKCLEGVPGLCFVLAHRDKLMASAGHSRTLSLDLFEQWKGLEANGQFRFTPPTHVVLAFDQALRELEAEGGVAGRAKRYAANHRILLAGMQSLGFRPYLGAADRSIIITAFHYPGDARFRFDDFYQRLSRHGMIIYPGKLGQVDCFRIGNIGRLSERDMNDLLQAVAVVLGEMGVGVPVAGPPVTSGEIIRPA